MNRTLTSLLLVLLLSACATEPRTPRHMSKGIRVDVVDQDEHLMPSAPPPVSAFALFPLLQGSLFGRMTTDPILSLPVNFNAESQLPLAMLEERIELVATAHSPQLNRDDLVVTPAATRLARVGTFFGQKADEDGSMGGWFADSRTREVLMLAYFSGKCTLKGSLIYGKTTLEIDLTIPGAGLRWIRVLDADSGREKLELADGTVPVSLVRKFRAPAQ